MSKKLELTCTYIVVKNFEKSVDFYTSLLQTKVDSKFENRWASIKTPNGSTIGLLSANYDKQTVKSGKNLKKHYNQEFIKDMTDKYSVGNTMVLNLKADDFKKEYKRIKALNPNYISKIQYVNFMCPYNFFMVQDPDGNQIEISDV